MGFQDLLWKRNADRRAAGWTARHQRRRQFPSTSWDGAKEMGKTFFQEYGRPLDFSFFALVVADAGS